MLNMVTLSLRRVLSSHRMLRRIFNWSSINDNKTTKVPKMHPGMV